jgi:hypothetical protein
MHAEAAAARRPSHGRLGQMGLARACGWVAAGGGEMGQAFELGPVRWDRICFFPNLFLMQKQFQKI